MNDKFLFKELTRQIIGVYFDVYNGLGRTYPEFVYENAMQRDLRQQGIPCQRQEEYQIFYKEQLVGLQWLDLFIAGEVIVEIKAVSQLTRLHKAQTFSYLKAFDKQVGLLFNFSNPQPEFERLFFQLSPPDTSSEAVEQTLTELPPDLIAPELIYDIIGGLYTVHTTLGPGFIHRIYANACYRELQECGLPVRPQKEMSVIYRGEPIATIKFAHLRVGNIALVFPVAVSNINDIRFNNIKEWLRFEQVPLAIVANFHDLALKPLILKG
jgi:GxxExxY protein